MPRAARIVVPDLPHHVVQRGNNQQDVFFTNHDRRQYLSILHEQTARYGVQVIAYCLMTNHVHLVVVPTTAAGLALAIGRAHWRYTRMINYLHARSGHLWQNRFFSCVMQPSHELAAVRYVERNPVRARLVNVPWRFPWSSAAAHCGKASDATGLLDLEVWSRRYPPHDWIRIVQDADDDGFGKQIVSKTFRGRPLASDKFLAKLETRLNRRLRTARQGRPKKTGTVTN